jgi:hypothetical protein
MYIYLFIHVSTVPKAKHLTARDISDSHGGECEDACLLGSCTVLAASILKAASTPETSINFYRATRCNNPEDCHLHLTVHQSEKIISRRKLISLVCTIFCYTNRIQRSHPLASHQNSLITNDCCRLHNIPNPTSSVKRNVA